MQQIKYRQWEFLVDREATKKLYEGTGEGNCTCSGCRNYEANTNSDSIFPGELIDLFEELGIDHRKPFSADHFYAKNGLHYYSGWFNFVGKIISGKSCAIPMAGGNGFTIDKMEQIDDVFGIGFHAPSETNDKVERKDIVQIEFDAWLPWVIEDEELT